MIVLIVTVTHFFLIQYVFTLIVLTFFFLRCFYFNSITCVPVTYTRHLALPALFPSSR
jgi:hypothetical protein